MLAFALISIILRKETNTMFSKGMEDLQVQCACRNDTCHNRLVLFQSRDGTPYIGNNDPEFEVCISKMDALLIIGWLKEAFQL